MADDDELDELFSFGNTPTAVPPSAEANFTLDDDDAGADAGSESPSSPLNSEAAGADDEEDIFGSPIVAAASAEDSSAPAPSGGGPRDRAGMDQSSDSFLDLAAGDDSAEPTAAQTVPKGGAGGGAGGRARLPSQSDEDFHAHDADTREMLDFLDVDDSQPGREASGVAEEGGGRARSSTSSAGDDILGVLDVVEEDGEATEAAIVGGGASPSKPSRLSTSSRAISAPASVASLDSSTRSSLMSVDSVGLPTRGSILRHSLLGGSLLGVDSMELPKEEGEGLSSEGPPAPSGDDADGSKEDAAGAATPKAKTSASSLPGSNSSEGALRPTIVALPPPPGSDDSPLAGRKGRIPSALLRSLSDIGDDDDDSGATKSAKASTVGRMGSAKSKSKPVPARPPPPPPPTFDTLSEAVRSPLSTLPQLRDLCQKGGFYDIREEDRPHLWCKVACHGRTLEDIGGSSVADSFLEWDETFEVGKDEKDEEEEQEQEEEGADEDGAEAEEEEEEDEVAVRVRGEASTLAPWVARGHCGAADGDDMEAEADAARSLRSILLFHYRSTRRDEDVVDGEDVAGAAGMDEAGLEHKEDEKKDGDSATATAPPNGKRIKRPAEWDPLLGPVTAALLSSGMSAASTSVVLANLMPSAMPLMALTDAERTESARSLHGRLYLLACYHLPLLVLHLDRYAPGWHWPKIDGEDSAAGSNDEGEDDRQEAALASAGSFESATEMSRNLRSRGTIPSSWFVSHLAGGGIGSDAGSAGAAMMEPSRLKCLWDVLLTNGDQSLKFFLALAVLEKHSDALLMLRGDELVEALGNAMSLRSLGVEGGGFTEDDEDCGTNAIDKAKGRDHRSDIEAWYDRARSLSESTPTSVLSDLGTAEDESVTVSLRRRRRMAEERMQARLEEEARRHREAREAERRKRDEEARAALIRSRLVAYYEKHNPEKVGNVDKILKSYQGRTDVLDKKLRAKYGEGFMPKIPVLNPMLGVNANKLLSTMNQGLQTKREQIVKVGKTWRARRAGDGDEGGFDLGNNVAVRVSAAEVLPVLCAGHGGKVAAEKDAKARARSSSAGPSSSSSNHPLHFYLVDSRPDETAGEQGRFPTATSLSPEALMDPDRIQQQVEVYESLRGAVHIVIMGEGFSSFPNLYDHRITAKEKALAEEDDSRASLCALFFIKKGFPFVSILDGGFAAAHAWLARDGSDRGLSMSSVLVDYEKTSLFAQLEQAYREQRELANASTKEKTTRALQKLMDQSMTGLTVTENQIENFYADMSNPEGREKMKQSVSKLFERDAQTAAELRNRFSNLRERVASTTLATSASSLDGPSPTGTSTVFNAALPQATSAPTKKPTVARDYGPPKEGNDETAASQFSAAGESIKNAVARFRISGNAAERKGDGEGNSGALARFRASLEDKETSDVGGSSNKKTSDGVPVRNTMARFRASFEETNFSGLSQTFAPKKEEKHIDEKSDGDKEKEEDTIAQGDIEKKGDGTSKKVSPLAQRGMFMNLAYTGRPQFGTRIKNPFAGKTESPGEEGNGKESATNSDRFSRMLKNAPNPFAAKVDGGVGGEVSKEDCTSSTARSESQRPQFGAMFRKVRTQDSQEDELLKSMREALGEDSSSAGGIGTTASAAGIRMKSALGSVSFPQKGFGVASMSSSTEVAKVSIDHDGGADSGVGINTFRKKLSGIASSRKSQHEEEEELISFDHDEGSDNVAHAAINDTPTSQASTRDSSSAMANVAEQSENKSPLNGEVATQQGSNEASEELSS